MEDEKHFSWAVRPQTLKEYIGQQDIKDKLKVSISAAKQRQEPHEHVLLHGPPGLGKTTLSLIIANEMKANLVSTSGPALKAPQDLFGILTNIQKYDVLFIDEIHRLSKSLEEYLYSAMEDFKIDFIIEKNGKNKTITIPVKPFTLIGATTQSGKLSGPLRTRFGISHHLKFYTNNELEQIVKRSAGEYNIVIDDESAKAIAVRSRGTPRTTNRLLRRVRDYADFDSAKRITIDCVVKTMNLEKIDHLGLDELDRQFLQTIHDVYKGGPVGINAIAATLNEEVNTFTDTVEPYLLQIGLLARTKTGRKLTDKAQAYLNLKPPA